MTGSPGDTEHDGFGPVTYQALSRIQQIGGARLHAAWNSIPHVTHFEEVDVTGLEQVRQQRNAAGAGPSLTLLAWIAEACVSALRQFPRFCASLDTENRRLAIKNYINLGLAVDTPAGLVVATILRAGEMNLGELGAAIRDLAERGRSGKLKPSEMEGTCFTISSLGNIGGTGFTPIVNAPDVAILGVCPARERPACVEGRIEPRLLLPLSLSYDHRVLNGADAGRFCAFLRQRLESPRIGAVDR